MPANKVETLRKLERETGALTVRRDVLRDKYNSIKEQLEKADEALQRAQTGRKRAAEDRNRAKDGQERALKAAADEKVSADGRLREIAKARDDLQSAEAQLHEAERQERLARSDRDKLSNAQEAASQEIAAIEQQLREKEQLLNGPEQRTEQPAPPLRSDAADGKCNNRPVCVEMGSPSVWSLQQAHYLLERNRMLNRTLRAKPLGELDANGVNSERMDVRQSYLGVSGEFDQKAGVENALARGKREEQVMAKSVTEARVRQLRGRRDQLAVERAERQYELQILQADPEKKSEAAAKQAEVDRVSAQINILNQQISDLGSANVDAMTLSSTSAAAAGAADKLTGTALDPASGLKARIGTKEASISASGMLDNNLHLQNEILAKQLTLLRDEAGPNQNVIFLELPQSIYTANGKGNDYMVRTKWKVVGTIARADTAQRSEDDYAVDMCSMLQRLENAPADFAGRTAMMDCVPEYYNKFLSRMRRATKQRFTQADLPRFAYKPASGLGPRTVELIPAKSYLHVNDFHASTRTKNFLGIAKTLIGFGLRLDYQNRKEAYENFLQQDVHASAMGKGSANFGWVFGPEPGSRHINPGIRTTFAVMHVPANTYALHIEKEYCYFKRDSDDIDKDCFPRSSEDALVAVPHEGDGFYLSRVFYETAPIGGVATVYLHGEGFSPQTTVMVDGYALHKALSLGDPRLAAEHNIAGPTAPADGQLYSGEYEIVNPGLILLRVRSSSNAPEGTPDIALISPNKAMSLNRMWDLYVNGKVQAVKDSPMFEGGFRLTSMKYMGRQGDKVKIMATGGPFDPTDLVEFGGNEETPRINKDRPGVMEFEADRPASSTWTLLVTSHRAKAPVTESRSEADPLTPDRKGKAVDVVLKTEKDKPAKLSFAFLGNNFYASAIPKLEGAESCEAAAWAPVRGSYEASADGSRAQFVVEDPPACVRVSFKAAKLDVDWAKHWPACVKRPEKPTEKQSGE